MKKILKAATLAASALPAISAADASVLTNFTFTGNFFDGYGTVAGQLEFADAGSGVAAEALYIQSATDYFGNPYVPTYGGQNLLDILQFIQTNSFDVTADGEVTSASFNAREFLIAPTYANIFVQLNSLGGYNTYSVSNADYSNESVGNQGGFAGVTFTPAALAPVPEPAVWMTMILGFCLIGGALRGRKASMTMILPKS
jgi:hypothetical protein